jgi:hypothetical protein
MEDVTPLLKVIQIIYLKRDFKLMASLGIIIKS